MLTRTLTPPHPIDLRRTIGPVRRGGGDPCLRFAADGIWRASRTPEGTATVHLRERGGRIEAEAWGDGADRALHDLPALLGCLDSDAGFDPSLHPVVAQLHHVLPGLRIGRTGAIFEAAVPTICEQKVTGFEARRSWRQIVRRWGERAPGPADLWVPPDGTTMAGVAYYDLHVLGVERKRADTIRRVAAQAGTLAALADQPPAALATRLGSITGVGPWTVAEVSLIALGDPDAVSVGDYHLPHQVCLALAGEPRGSDQRMLELLEPFLGHRGRVCRLITAGGFGAPRRGPRMAPHDIARI